jgi:hypothetical protein
MNSEGTHQSVITIAYSLIISGALLLLLVADSYNVVISLREVLLFFVTLSIPLLLSKRIYLRAIFHVVLTLILWSFILDQKAYSDLGLLRPLFMQVISFVIILLSSFTLKKFSGFFLSEKKHKKTLLYLLGIILLVAGIQTLTGYREYAKSRDYSRAIYHPESVSIEEFQSICDRLTGKRQGGDSWKYYQDICYGYLSVKQAGMADKQ